MTLRKEINKSRSEFQRTTDHIMTADDIERIIDRIDDIEEIVIKKEFDIVKRLSEIEDEIVNINTYIHNLEPFPTIQPPVSIPNIPEEVLRDAIEIFKATVAEKKRELTKREHPEE